MNNTITKIGELFVGSVGLTTKRAREESFDVVTAKYSGEVRSEYYPPSSRITVKLVKATSARQGLANAGRLRDLRVLELLLVFTKNSRALFQAYFRFESSMHLYICYT